MPVRRSKEEVEGGGTEGRKGEGEENPTAAAAAAASTGLRPYRDSHLTLRSQVHQTQNQLQPIQANQKKRPALLTHLPLFSRAAKPGRIGQIPRPTGAAVQEADIEVLRREEGVAPLRVDERQVRVQDALPAALYAVKVCPVGKVRVPLLLDKLLRARERGARVERQHVDALDELGVAAEVGGVVDLVLEQDARDLVADEAGRLRRVGAP